MRLYPALFLLALSCVSAHAEVHPSDLRHVLGVKFPSAASEGVSPVFTSALALSGEKDPGGFSELLPYALAAPDQDEANSCLYMSLNGIAEWWMAKLHPELSRDPDGPLHFSERYMMNYASTDESQKNVKDWLTDSIEIFNNAGGTVLNEDYRFTKGWFRDTSKGIVKSHEGTKGAEYGVQYNWIDESEQVASAPRIKLPRFKRDVIFAPEGASQWDTAVMPQDIADQIKEALLKNKAPVHVVYNHQGYWHATIILGFNDELDNQNCAFVEQYFTYATDKIHDLLDKANHASGDKREKLLKEAATVERRMQKTRKAFDDGGGCHPKGVFYVRDSIYGDPDGPIYHYELNNPKGDAPFSKKIVLLEYDWVRTLANHVSQIYLE